jgi:ParB family chromosome partitioning protein
MPTKYGKIQNISLEFIDDPRLAIRTRYDDESMDTLVNSIRTLGVLQPILVKPVKGRFEVIAGHRRLLAVRILGGLTIPCIVCSLDDPTAEVLKLHENFCREEVNIVDEAIFLEGVMAKYNLSVAELAKKIGRSETYVRERIAMKEWDKVILDAVWRGDISASAAAWLNKISNEAVRHDWLSIGIRGGLTTSQAQHWYQQWSMGQLPEKPTEEIVEDLKTGQPVLVKKVKCSLCGLEMPLTEAILLYGHKECSDYWKIQQRVNAEAEKEKK